MRILSLSFVSALALVIVAVPVADAWAPPSLPASLTKYDIRATIRSKRTNARRIVLSSVELPTPAKGGLLFGSVEAPTTIVMFTDIECPFCKRFHALTYPTLKKEYIDTKKVRFVIRHFPLPFHTNADDAAKAVICAREQSDDAARSLYEALITVSELSSQSIAQSIAGIKNIDGAKMSKCTERETAQKVIEADVASGQAAKVNGTPSFLFIGPSGTQKLVPGAVLIETFRTAIEDVQKK